MIDDVWENVGTSDKYYKSIAAHECLQEIQNANLIDKFNLVPKRLAFDRNLPWTKKYIALFTKDGKF